MSSDLNDEHARQIGDCYVPSSIADAVYSGHKFAREFGELPEKILPKREQPLIQMSLAGETR